MALLIRHVLQHKRSSKSRDSWNLFPFYGYHICVAIESETKMQDMFLENAIEIGFLLQLCDAPIHNIGFILVSKRFNQSILLSQV